MGPPGPKSTFKEKIFSLKNTWATLALFLLVIGGIYGGIFTPTEAGAIGSFGAIVIALAMRRLSGRTFLDTLLESGLMVGMILLILIGVSIMIKFTAISKLPFILGEIASGLDVSPLVIVIAIVIMYIILGCFMDVMMVIMLTVPIVHPIIVALGFSPIWFGVIIVRMAEIGGITPPFGMQGFVLSGMSGVPLGTIYRGVLPFVIADFIHISLLLAFPVLSLYLPNTM
jgi:tripartite ATP-independent transporter DctM subunit